VSKKQVVLISNKTPVSVHPKGYVFSKCVFFKCKKEMHARDTAHVLEVKCNISTYAYYYMRFYKSRV